jgi:hypothetical protein
VLVTTFTIERFIGVVYPLKRTLLLSIAHARCVIVAEALVCAALATFTAFTIGIETTQKQKLGFNDTDCDILTGMGKIYAGCNVAFLIVGSIAAPVLIIVALNAAIFSRVIGRSRLNLFATDNFTNNDTITSSQASSSHSSHHCHHYEYNVTLLLLVVSTTFVVLNVPYCVCWFLLFMKVGFDMGVSGSPSCEERQLIGRLHAAKYIASVPYYLNYGINFALYALCARAFRNQLCRVLLIVRRRATCGRATESGNFSAQYDGTDGQRRLQLRRELAAVRLRLPADLISELGPPRPRTTSEPPISRRPRKVVHEIVSDESKAATN